MWATPQDVADRWVGSPVPDWTIAQPHIEDAEVLIRFEFPDIDERAEKDSALLGQLKFVVCQMVMRVLRNPDGARSTQQGAGPFQQTKTFGGDKPGSVWMTEDEYAMLSGRRSAGNQKAFMIDLLPPR